MIPKQSFCGTVKRCVVDLGYCDNSLLHPPLPARKLWLLKSKEHEDVKAGTTELPAFCVSPREGCEVIQAGKPQKMLAYLRGHGGDVATQGPRVTQATPQPLRTFSHYWDS